MNSRLSVGDRWRIVSLRFDQGITPNRIASIVNCSRAVFFSILQLFHETNNVIECEGRGCTLLNKTDSRQYNSRSNDRKLNVLSMV